MGGGWLSPPKIPNDIVALMMVKFFSRSVLLLELVVGAAVGVEGDGAGEVDGSAVTGGLFDVDTAAFSIVLLISSLK